MSKTLREYLETYAAVQAAATEGRRVCGDPPRTVGDWDIIDASDGLTFASAQFERDARAIAATTGGADGIGVAMAHCALAFLSLHEHDRSHPFLAGLLAAFEANEVQS